MAQDLVMGLWAIGLLIGISIPVGFGLCWLMIHDDSSNFAT
ncbi:hypothetical protein [Lyngbya confervoides]|nr:hypothetical protein [Lyngbya confervoides]